MTDKKKINDIKGAGKGKKIEFKLNLNLRRLLIWGLILFLFLPAIMGIFADGSLLPSISLSEAVSDIKQKKIESVDVRGDELVLHYSEGTDPLIKTSRKEEGASFMEILQRAGVDEGQVKIVILSQAVSKAIMGILSLVLPILGFGLLMYFLMRRRGGGDMMFGMGKSKAKLFAKGKQFVKFSDVAGVDEAKKELEEIVDFLKSPKKYKDVGARTPKGVLLTGPSGVGKTLLARAVAGEAGVAFFSMAGSEFMEMLVGVGASRVRDLFDTAKKQAPSIIFIDELDAIGRMRGGGGAMGGHDEREQTLNQILVEIDGFTKTDNVVVIAATNRPDVLDSALVRPGRFDRRVNLDLPDIEGRKGIIAIHAKGKPFVKSLNWLKIAKRTVGFSGADLENMLNEAAIRAASAGKKIINMSDIEEAAMRVKLGPEKKRLQSKKEREMTAYHEAGHAIVGHILEGTDPVHRVSIVSRGMALGYTMSRPDRDKYSHTENELKDNIASMLGGRAAEKLVFDELTGGAASDIEKATRIARTMVEDLGMSKLGPVAMGTLWDRTSWGKMYSEPSKISDEMRARVDVEVKRLVDEGYKRAEVVLKKNRKKMDNLVKVLLDIETVEQKEFEKIMK